MLTKLSHYLIMAATIGGTVVNFQTLHGGALYWTQFGIGLANAVGLYIVRQQPPTNSLPVPTQNISETGN